MNTSFGISAMVTVFKKQIEIESKSENLKRFEFNKGNPVEFEKSEVLESFEKHNITLSQDIVKAMPKKTNLIRLLYDAGTGEVDVAVRLEFDEAFITNKFHEIVSLDSIGLSLRRLPDGEVEENPEI
jgi:formyltetrahydrofolate synthetase